MPKMNALKKLINTFLLLRFILEDGMVWIDLLQGLEGVEGDQLNVGDHSRKVDCLVRLEPLSEENL